MPPKVDEDSKSIENNQEAESTNNRAFIINNHLEEDNSLNQLNDTSHVSIVTIKDDKDIHQIKTPPSHTPSSSTKIKTDNKTIFQIENEQNMSFHNKNQNKQHSDKDHSDYNHRQQQSVSPRPPPSNQQFLISTKQNILITEQSHQYHNEKEVEFRSNSNNNARSRPHSYIEMVQENTKESSKSRSNKLDKIQQIEDKLSDHMNNSLTKHQQNRNLSATRCTRTDQSNQDHHHASLEFGNRNVPKREPSNAGSLSSVDSNQQSISRNSKIIEKGMAMVQLRKNKVGDKVSIIIGWKKNSLFFTLLLGFFKVLGLLEILADHILFFFSRCLAFTLCLAYTH